MACAMLWDGLASTDLPVTLQRIAMMRLRSLTTFAVAVSATFAARCASESRCADTDRAAGGVVTSSARRLAQQRRRREDDHSAASHDAARVGHHGVQDDRRLGWRDRYSERRPDDRRSAARRVERDEFTITARAGSRSRTTSSRTAPSSRCRSSRRRASRHEGRAVFSTSLSLGYYQDPNHVTSVTELLNVNVDLLHPRPCRRSGTSRATSTRAASRTTSNVVIRSASRSTRAAVVTRPDRVRGAPTPTR